MEIPEDVYGLIFARLDFLSAALLACVCCEARKAYLAVRGLKFGSVRLSAAQAEIRRRVLAMPAGEGAANLFGIQAPMGFGKTIVGLSIALEKSAANRAHRYLIVVPPKAYDTWVKEWAKVSGARASAPDSPVLFAHSSVPLHRRRFVAAVEALAAGGPEAPGAATRALGPKVRALVLSATSCSGWELAGAWAGRAIADEAHAATSRVRSLLAGFRWLALMSANRMEGECWDSVAIAARQLTGLVPAIVVRHLPIDACPGPGSASEATHYATAAHKTRLIADNLPAYERALTAVFAEIAWGQVVVFVPDGAAGTLIAEAIPGIATGWEVLSFVNSTSRIREFESYARGVLVIRLNKSEALNILASHMVIARPDWVNETRYGQLIGRVARPTNRNPAVPVFVIAPRGLPMNRLRYYEANRELLLRGVALRHPQLYRAGEFERADGTLRALGSSLATAAPTELMAALGVGFDEPESAGTLYACWLGEPARALRDEHMRALLGLRPPAGEPELDAGDGPAHGRAATEDDAGDEWLDGFLEELVGAE
jgi:hypothetical protein